MATIELELCRAVAVQAWLSIPACLASYHGEFAVSVLVTKQFANWTTTTSYLVGSSIKTINTHYLETKYVSFTSTHISMYQYIIKCRITSKTTNNLTLTFLLTTQYLQLNVSVVTMTIIHVANVTLCILVILKSIIFQLRVLSMS